MEGNHTAARLVPRGRRGEAGFTLIELVIVTGVISILAAMTVPKLLESKDSSYETTAHVFLRTIHQSQITFASREGRYASMTELVSLGYIKNPPQSYATVLTVDPDANFYTATATPLVRPLVLRHFYVDTSGVVRFESGAPADVNSTAL